MASSGTTPSANEDRGQRLLASILSFSALVFVIYLARIWTRLRPKYALTAADYTITVAMVAKTLNIVFLVLAVQNGFGKHMVHIPGGTAGIITVSNLVLGCWMTGVLVSGFGRISIASLLLTLTSSFRWKMLLRLTIALQLLYMLTYEVVQLVQCQNIISSKSRVPSSSSPSSTSSPPPPSSSSQCLSRTSVFVFQLVSISIDMLSDLVCALLPILIVWRLSRSTLEKLLVILLMTSCLAATLCGIPKLYYLVTFDFSGRDQLYDLIPEFFWFRMEEGIVIAAACAPLLKGPVERCMRRVGLPTFGIPTRDLNTVSEITRGSKMGWREGGGRMWRWRLGSESDSVTDVHVEEGVGGIMGNSEAVTVDDNDGRGTTEKRIAGSEEGGTATYMTTALTATAATSTSELTVERRGS